jgi:hypothetical protein
MAKTRHQRFASSPVLIRLPPDPEGEREAILWLKVVN